jgi:hypothetical protein
MTAGEEHATLLRAYLQGDQDAFGAQVRSISPEGPVSLVHAAFGIAAKRTQLILLKSMIFSLQLKEDEDEALVNQSLDDAEQVQAR